MARIALITFALTLAFAQVLTAQTSRPNNPYAPSPTVASNASAKSQVASTRRPETAIAKNDAPTTALTATVAPSGALTSFYKVGVGDTIFVNLVNSPGASGNYIVRTDGTIDLAIVGSSVQVAGKTTASIAGTIARMINVYSNPQVEVKVSRFGSHKVEVFGLVERSGEKCIQREAVPLYVIKADAGVDAKATRAIVKRAGQQSSTVFQLSDAGADEILIMPGDSIEFA